MISQPQDLTQVTGRHIIGTPEFWPSSLVQVKDIQRRRKQTLESCRVWAHSLQAEWMYCRWNFTEWQANADTVNEESHVIKSNNIVTLVSSKAADDQQTAFTSTPWNLYKEILEIPMIPIEYGQVSDFYPCNSHKTIAIHCTSHQFSLQS